MPSLKIRLTRTYKEVCRELTKERLESLEIIEVSSVLMAKLGYIIYEHAICLQRCVELIKRWRMMRSMIKTIGKNVLFIFCKYNICIFKMKNSQSKN